MLRPLQPLAAASSAASRRSLVPRLLLRQQPLLRRFSSSSRTGSRPGAGGGSAGSGGSGGSGQSSSNAWVNPLNRVPGGGGDKGDALHKYGSDLTAMAREGKLDTVVGRDEEIRRTIQVLSRRRKNNPVLIGEPGVGKTAVAEGLAQRIVDREVPDSMRSRRLIAVDMGTLLAGAKFRGEFEERFKGVLKEAADSEGEVILFIDEIHSVMGAGDADGAMDASALLKPQLARGEIAVVGATTLNEYRAIEKDAALARRFQPVMVAEPTPAESLTILRGIKEKYQAHHGVHITDAALVAAVAHAKRYLVERKLPDSAIDLLDEAASRLRLQHESKPEPIADLEREVLNLQIELEALRRESGVHVTARRGEIRRLLHAKQATAQELGAAWSAQRETLEQRKAARASLQQARADLAVAERDGDLVRAGELTYAIIPRLEKEFSQWSEAAGGGAGGEGAETGDSDAALLSEQVTEAHIAEIVARATGIPAARLVAGEREKLLQMEATLARSVIGQDEALAVVSNAVRVSRAGLQSSERPLGTFMLVGPTGVGKTHLCKALAEFLFDSADAVTRLDMSEFSEKHAVSRLVGAPPGYVGYDEGGQLTEAVRRRPYSVLLLDEFEKAHREVATLLLQVLDEGRLTDSQGKTVDFRNTIIIMTSNLGAEALASLPEGAASSKARPEVLKAIADAFPPEFVNRLDEIVLFERLTRERIAAICAVEVQQLRERLSARGVRLRLSPDALLRLAEAGYDPAYGARPVRRAIRHHLLDPLSRLLIGDQEAQDGATVLVDTKDTGAGAGGGAAQPSIVPPLPGVPFATGLFGAGGAAAAVPPSDMAAAVRIRLLAPGAPLPPEDTGVDWDEGPESAA